MHRLSTVLSTVLATAALLALTACGSSEREPAPDTSAADNRAAHDRAHQASLEGRERLDQDLENHDP